MKALAFKRFGGPDQAAFADILRPVPNPDEILVRVHAAGLNPVDHKNPGWADEADEGDPPVSVAGHANC